MSGSCVRSTRPARTSASTERLTAGAPRPTAAATWLSVAGSLASDRRQQLAPRALGALGRAVRDPVLRDGVNRAASAAGDDPHIMFAA